MGSRTAAVLAVEEARARADTDGAERGMSAANGTEDAAATRLRRQVKAVPPGRDEIDYGVLGQQVGFWIRRAHLRVLDSYSVWLGQFDLRPVEVTILVLLGNNDGLTQIALGTALDTDQSTMVNLLARLEQRKFILRRRLATDRRFQITRLTAAGRKLLVDIERVLKQHNDALLSALADSERPELIRLLTLLNRVESPSTGL